jgi:hypothetical protein
MALLQVTCESFATTIDDPRVRFNCAREAPFPQFPQALRQSVSASTK